MLIKRLGVGLACGLLIGAGVLAGLQFYWEPATAGQFSTIALSCLIGGLLGGPVGIISAGAASSVDYRSGWGIEWGAVGVLAALLTAALIGHFTLRPLCQLVVLLALVTAVTERSTAYLFADKSYEASVTSATFLTYGLTVLALAVLYTGLFGITLYTVD